MEFYTISEKTVRFCVSLQKRQYELSQTEENQRKIQEWYAHNSLKGKRPMIHLEMWTLPRRSFRRDCAARESLPEIETDLYVNFLNQELFDDDRVTRIIIRCIMIRILRCLILR